jgi:pseudouridine-5'-phosphate glycosidase
VDADQLEYLATRSQDAVRKCSRRDLPLVLARHEDGGTTVAATMAIAHRAGIELFATGGIGGVHPLPGPPDVSADLFQLARSPVVLVCSGPKAFVDPVATFERLESLGVAVLALGCDELPCFWTRDTGLAAHLRVDTAAEVAEIWAAARRLGEPGAILVCVPPPEEAALSREENERAVGRALRDLEVAGVTGPRVTPYLLTRIAAYTDGRSVDANLALLAENARVAAKISVRCSVISGQ